MSSWSEMYREVPPWDIGRPQPAFVALHASGRLPKGRLLDAGCGTGENALFFASQGYTVVGIDLTPRAIELAKAKSRDRGISAEFRVGDALRFARLRTVFDVVIDSGLFHTFSDDDRPVYLSGIAHIVREGGVFAMLCFSEREPADWDGPRRVTRGEIEASFASFIAIEEIRDARFATRFHRDPGGFAYLAIARAVGNAPSRRAVAHRARR